MLKKMQHGHLYRQGAPNCVHQRSWLNRNAFTHTDTFLRTNAFSHIVFSHAGAFTHNCFYTQTESHRWFSQLFLHRNIFTLMALHTHACAHTHTHFYRNTLLHREVFYTQTFSHTHTQTHAFLHTHMTVFQNVVFWFVWYISRNSTRAASCLALKNYDLSKQSETLHFLLHVWNRT